MFGCRILVPNVLPLPLGVHEPNFCISHKQFFLLNPDNGEGVVCCPSVLSGLICSPGEKKWEGSGLYFTPVPPHPPQESLPTHPRSSLPGHPKASSALLFLDFSLCACSRGAEKTVSSPCVWGPSSEMMCRFVFPWLNLQIYPFVVTVSSPELCHR